MGAKGGTKIPVADYLMSMHLGICKGPIDHINQIYVKELPIWCGQISENSVLYIDLPNLFGGDKKEGGVSGVIEAYFGGSDQIMNPTVATRYGKTSTTMPGYRGIANLFFRGYQPEEIPERPDNVLGGLFGKLFSGFAALFPIFSEDAIKPTGGFKWISNNPYLPGIWVNVTRVPKTLSNSYSTIYSQEPDYVADLPFDVTENVDTFYKLSDFGYTDADVDNGLVSFKMNIAAEITGVGLGEGLTLQGYIGTEFEGYANNAGGTAAGAAIGGSRFVQGSTVTSSGSATDTGVLPAGVRWVRFKPIVLLTYPVFSIYTITTKSSSMTMSVYGPSYCTINNHLGVLPDANPAHMIYEALTDRDWGMGAPRESVDIGSFMYAAETFFNEKFGLSIAWTQQAEIDTYVKEILDHVQSALFIDPRTGLWTLVPFRNDYDVSTLGTLDPTNCKALNRQRKALGETVNEVVVTWTNPDNEQEETITYQDLGNISAQGGVISTTRNYYGIRNAALANFVGARDIRSAAYPLFGCDIVADRSMSYLRPGSVVKFNWPDDGIVNMVLRVSKVDYGKPGDSSIKISVTEDIFALEQTVYQGAQETLWIDPDTIAPTPMSATEIITSPLPLLLRSGVSLANLSDSSYPLVSVAVFADRNTGDVDYFDLVGPLIKPTGETYTGVVGTLFPTSYGSTTTTWAAKAKATITAAELSAFIGINTPDTGDFLHVEGPDGDRSSEIVMLDSFAAGVWTLARGMFDTIPRKWPIGTRVWFINDHIQPPDLSERASGVSVSYQLLPKSPSGTLDIALAPVVSFTPSDRPYAPFRPANISMVAVGGTEPTVPYPTSLQNGGAEIASMAGWSAVSNIFQVNGVSFSPPLLSRTGSWFFWTVIAAASAQMEQNLSVPPGLWSRVDAGTEQLEVSWYQAGTDTVTDPCRVELIFKDGAGATLSTVVGPDQYSGRQSWLHRSQLGAVPALCRSAVVRFVATRIGDGLLGCAIDDITCKFDQGAFQSLLFLQAGIPTSLSLGWSNRNRLSEDVVAPRWTEPTITPETGQTTTIRVKDRFSPAVEFGVSGLTGTTYSLAVSGLTSYRFYDIEFLSVRDGFESIQAGKLELELIRLGFGNNYGFDYGENDGS